MKGDFLRASDYGKIYTALAVIMVSLLVTACVVTPPAASEPMMEEEAAMADNMTILWHRFA